ncbi:hypothetical protein BC939DRAFT_281231 [Gamsiella multidivaricata]|uniref:uncharacterized protein n=1 Tax=Gamsiella multidivaricata TaxID=101098 RepID=UPI00221F14BE|nr:uncharacterized protein BC939DRAFT_281231 [Gamsiella multidivaricata]KAI7830399.1 hypothetical protein BC939DRAFT_281231 [Gamsiella multidivaricata]
MRFEHELKAQELIKKGAENKAANDAELASLQQQLVAAVEKHNDVIVLREKLEETKALHATTIEELNRIHDDKLQSLESELQMAKQQRLRGSNLSGHVQDLEEIMETHEQELTRLLKEHQQEIDAVNADFDNQKKQEVEEYETEVKERLDSELEQIKASQASLLNDRLGTESNMSEVLQERHDRAWEDLKVKTAKEHAHYLSAVQNKHQSELSRLEVKHAASTTELEKKVAKLQQKYDTDMMSIRSKADTSVEELKNKHENEIKACAEKHAAELVAMELSTKDNMQSELDAVQKNFASFVADIQGTQDNAMRSLENGYETRIAELIVGHENRVRELENEANEQVQQELERVEMEFEIDRERLAEEQAKKIAELKAAHEVTLEQLEDQLTKAEDRAKELIATIKRTRQTHEMEMSEVKADLEAQLSAVEISIEALVISKQQDDKGRAETLEAGHATVISAKKSVHEMNLNEALTMKETAWRTKTEPLLREIEIMRERLQDTQSERDKAQSAMKAMEIRLKEEYGAALEGLNRDHSSRVEQRQQAAHARADRLMKPHSDNADVHESKLADLLTSHHQKLQTMNDQHQAVLKVQEQTNQGRVKALQQSIEALSIKAGGSETMVSLQKLAELKKQNELLKGENQQLESMVKQLQGSMTTIA